MKIEFSKHALGQMQQRQISVAIVTEILKNPDQVLDQNDNKVYQSIISLEDERYLIRIFVNENKDPNLVITAYKTSKIDKYYEGKI